MRSVVVNHAHALRNAIASLLVDDKDARMFGVREDVTSVIGSDVGNGRLANNDTIPSRMRLRQVLGVSVFPL